MSRILIGALALVFLSVTAVAEDTPGVTSPMPGVTQVDGSKVPSVGIDVAALEALIKEKPSFRAAKRLLQSEGVTSVGPAGSTVHIYKAHDTVTGKNLLLILFVKDDEIVDHSVNWL